MLLYAVVSLACCIAALTAWRWARRGRRIDDHPLCRKCGYDLIGLHRNSKTTCPECGKSVGSARRVHIGNRQPRVAIAWIAFCFAVLTFATAIGLTWVAAVRFDWNTVKPLSMLIEEASDSSHPAAADAALSELDHRFNAGDLTTQQIKQLVDAALDYQGDINRPWDDRWGQWVAAARSRRIVADDEWCRYIIQASQIDLLVRENINVGDPCVVSHALTQPIRGDRSLDGLSARDQQAKYCVRQIQDGIVDKTPILQFTYLFGWGKTLFRDERSYGLDQLDPGRYQLSVTIQLTCPDSQVRSHPLLTAPVELKAEFEVYPAETLLIKPVRDSELAVQATTFFESIFQRQNGGQILYDETLDSFCVTYGLNYPKVNCWGSYDIHAYVSDSDIAPHLRFVFPPNTTNDWIFTGSFTPPNTALTPFPEISSFTIRFVPNPDHLKEELDGYEYLDHVIEIRDIPLSRTGRSGH